MNTLESRQKFIGASIELIEDAQPSRRETEKILAEVFVEAERELRMVKHIITPYLFLDPASAETGQHRIVLALQVTVKDDYLPDESIVVDSVWKLKGILYGKITKAMHGSLLRLDVFWEKDLMKVVSGSHSRSDQERHLAASC